MIWYNIILFDTISNVTIFYYIQYCNVWYDDTPLYHDIIVYIIPYNIVSYDTIQYCMIQNVNNTIQYDKIASYDTILYCLCDPIT